MLLNPNISMVYRTFVKTERMVSKKKKEKKKRERQKGGHMLIKKIDASR